MALRRVLALLLVAGMITGAVLLRAAREEQTQQALDEGFLDADAALTLTCASVLQVVCADLVAVLRDDGVDVGAAAQPAQGGVAPAVGAVLTLDPLQELVVPGAAGAAAQDPRVLARSPLVVAIWDDRHAALAAHCGGSLTWRCIGEAAGTPQGTWSTVGGEPAWGVVKPGHDAPDTSETAALVLGQMAAGYFGRADLSANDLDDPGFFSWFVGVQNARGASPAGDVPLLRMIQAGPGALDVVAVAEAQAVDLLARSAGRAANLGLRPVEPVVTADVVVVGVGEDEAVQELVDAIVDRGPALLSAAGWRVAGQANAGALGQVGIPDLDLPDATGLPPAGTLDALRRTWAEVTR